MKIECERCKGSGLIGKRTPYGNSREAPGPVPEDARGWVELYCPDCRGKGYIEVEGEGEDDESIPYYH